MNHAIVDDENYALEFLPRHFVMNSNVARNISLTTFCAKRISVLPAPHFSLPFKCFAILTRDIPFDE